MADIELDRDAHPYVLFSTQIDGRGLPRGQGGMDLRYHYARWDGTSWHTEEIAQAGRRLYAGEDDYSGLGALDPKNPDVMYISTDADPVSGDPLVSHADRKRHYELFRGQRDARLDRRQPAAGDPGVERPAHGAGLDARNLRSQPRRVDDVDGGGHHSSARPRRPLARLPRHRAFGVLPSDLGGFLVRGANHDAFLDHVDHVARTDRVEVEDLLSFGRGQDLGARLLHRGRQRSGPAFDAKRERHVAGAPFSEADARDLGALLRVRQRVLIFELQAKKKLPARVERPRVGFLEVLVLRDSPDSRCGRRPVNASPPLGDAVIDAFFVVGQAHRLHKRPRSARRVRVTQEDAVHAGRQDLLEHPRVRAHRCFVSPVHRDVHDDGGRTVTAFRRPALHETPHVVCEALDVEGRVLHVVADVVGPRLRVPDALLEAPFRALMRSGVVDGLSLLQRLNRAVDPRGLGRGGARKRAGGACNGRQQGQTRRQNASRHGCLISFPSTSLLPRPRALGVDVQRVERLAGGHEETIALRPAKAQIRTDLRQADTANQLALGRPDRDAVVPDGAARVARAPDVAADIASDAVRRASHAIDHEV